MYLGEIVSGNVHMELDFLLAFPHLLALNLKEKFAIAVLSFQNTAAKFEATKLGAVKLGAAKPQAA